MRIGQGYDLHRLVPERKLIIGGVEIPFEKGLLGHSDADVLLHAITDALLGACALGDIGRLFPDTEEKYKGADSRALLREAYLKVREKGYTVVNIDATVIAQQPKLAPYTDGMRRSIALALDTEEGNISVKAKTDEGLGVIGSGEAIAAHAVCLLK